MRKTWETVDGLKLAVREALDYAKATVPRTGWVRGNSLTNLEALEELNTVRKQNEEFRALVGELSVDIAIPPLPSVDDTTEIDVFPEDGRFRAGLRGSYAKIKTSWISVFPFYFDNLKWSSNDWNGEFYHTIDEDVSRTRIGSSLAGELYEGDTSSLFAISQSAFQRLTSYYIEAGLVLDSGERPFTPAANRLARRLRIRGHLETDFEITDGEIVVSKVIAPFSDMDEDIPF